MKNVGMVVAVEIKAVLDRYGEGCEDIRLPGYTIKRYTVGGAAEFEQEKNRSAQVCLDITDKIIGSL